MPEVRVTKDQAVPTEEYSKHEWEVEASTLGLKPGEWPTSIHTDIGNGMPFQFERVNDIGDHVYRQVWGCTTLLVIND